MDFRPRNKYLLVTPVEEKKPEIQTSGFILPNDYKVAETYKVVKLVQVPSDSSYGGAVGNLLLVSSNMIEEIKVMNTILHVVPEAAVYGVFYG
jgi:hypothetical protein